MEKFTFINTVMAKKSMYQKAIVTFLDILGFSNLVSQSKPEKVKLVLDAVLSSTSPISINDDVEEDDQAEVISFSDSIVRVRKYETKKNLEHQQGLLFQELISLVHAQGELIKHSIIIRGSVSFGDIYISSGQVYGPGLISAYELESKYALYPRIIIDPQLIEEYKTNKLLKAKWHSYEDEIEFVGNLVKQGDDGMWFIDYAKALERELDEPEMYPIFLRKHREVIIEGAKKHKKLNSILSKYIWMANYHNKLVSNISKKAFKHYGCDKSDFLITSQEIQSLQYIEP